MKKNLPEANFSARPDEAACESVEKELIEAQRIGKIGNWDWDIATDTITWSKEYYRIFGFDPAQKPPKYEEHLKIYTPESAARLDAAVKKNTATGEPYELDLEIANPQSGARWITARSETKRDETGKIIGLRGTAQDITDRKLVEIELERKNRILRMLSDTNQTLIHTADEMTLLNKICQIAIDLGGYKLAWIGFAENNKEKDIRPVAHVGFESGYLEALKLTWADTERGRGPSGVAIRTGKPSVARNIATDPAMAPWRADALKRGYLSSIALPLTTNDKVFGMLAIYSGEPDVFNDDEVKILKELADDLSFGLTSLRADAARKILEEELLQASADRYKALFLSSRDAIMTLEPPDWRFTSGNPATIKMFAVKSEGDFLLHDPWTLSPELQPDGRQSMEKAKAMIDQAMSQGLNLFEWTHKRANGEEFPAEVLLSKVEQGKKIFLHALVRDITERKKMEEKLKEFAEEKFKVIFDSASDGMILADAATKKFAFGNAAFCRLVGCKPEEIQTLGVGDIHPEKDLPYVEEQFDKLLKRKIKVAENIPVKKMNGDVFYADISAALVSINGKKYLLGTFRDITERQVSRKKEKEYLKELEKMNKLMIGRELKMIELKEEIEKLKKKAGL